MGNIIDAWRAMIAQQLVEGPDKPLHPGLLASLNLMPSKPQRPSMANDPLEIALDAQKRIPTTGGSIGFDMYDEPIILNQPAIDAANNYNATVVAESQRKADEDFARQQQYVDERNYNVGEFNASATGQRAGSFTMSLEEGAALESLGLGVSDEGYSLSLRSPMPPPKYNPKVIKPMPIPAEQWKTNKTRITASKPKPGGGGSGTPKKQYGEPIVFYYQNKNLITSDDINYLYPIDLWVSGEFQDFPNVSNSMLAYQYNNGVAPREVWQTSTTSPANYSGTADNKNILQGKLQKKGLPDRTLNEIYGGKPLTMEQQMALYVGNIILKTRQNAANPTAIETAVKNTWLQKLFYPTDLQGRTPTQDYRILELDNSAITVPDPANNNKTITLPRSQYFVMRYWPGTVFDTDKNNNWHVKTLGKKDEKALKDEVLTPLYNVVLTFIENNESLVAGNKLTQFYNNKYVNQLSLKKQLAAEMAMKLFTDIVNGKYSTMP